MRDYRRPAKTIPRSPGIMAEWFAAIKAGQKSTTDFSAYSGPLTEVMLLANIALRFKDAKIALHWDPVKIRPTGRAGRCSGGRRIPIVR
jgi:hypothetical protein